MHTVKLSKVNSTWTHTVINPSGGSFGSCYCGPLKIALHRATHGMKPGTIYRLIVNGKDKGIHTKEPTP